MRSEGVDTLDLTRVDYYAGKLTLSTNDCRLHSACTCEHTNHIAQNIGVNLLVLLDCSLQSNHRNDHYSVSMVFPFEAVGGLQSWEEPCQIVARLTRPLSIGILVPQRKNQKTGGRDIGGCLGCYTSYGFNIIQMDVVRCGFTTNTVPLFSGSYPGGRVYLNTRFGRQNPYTFNTMYSYLFRDVC